MASSNQVTLPSPRNCTPQESASASTSISPRPEVAYSASGSRRVAGESGLAVLDLDPQPLVAGEHRVEDRSPAGVLQRVGDQLGGEQLGRVGQLGHAPVAERDAQPVADRADGDQVGGLQRQVEPAVQRAPRCRYARPGDARRAHGARCTRRSALAGSGDPESAPELVRCRGNRD